MPAPHPPATRPTAALGRMTVLVMAAFLLASVAVPASAAIRGNATVQTTGQTARVSVVLTGVAGVPARSRPSAMTLTLRGKVVPLRRAGRSDTWRSAVLRGATARAARALGGARVTVHLRAPAGRRAIRIRVRPAAATTTPTPATPTTPTVPSPAPLFAAPAQELTGQPALDHVSRYFLNSRFTDCPAGWPACAVEERYRACPDGSWGYNRLTPTSGADINSVGTYQVTGAVARTDGSWGVEYLVSAYDATSFYSWNVSAAGAVTGAYWAPGSLPPAPASQALGPLVWVAGGC